jgi:hypothetical protein
LDETICFLILDRKGPRWMSVSKDQLTLSPKQGITHIAVIFVTGAIAHVQ